MKLEDSVVNAAMFKLLEEAQDNNWEFTCGNRNDFKSATIFINGKLIAETEEEKQILGAACDRMLNELSWIRNVKGFLYRVTDKGRDALKERKAPLKVSRSNQMNFAAEASGQLLCRYGVFISSTYSDLRDEREALMEMVLEKDHFPLGMELFGADNGTPWEVMERKIRECDYYLLIIAMRYGSISKDVGVSFTEREYDYAYSIQKPIAVFIMNERALSDWPDEHIDKGESARLLESFKFKLKEQKQIAQWVNQDELARKAGTALDRLIKDHPQIGWVRSNANATRHITTQSSDLSGSADTAFRSARPRPAIGVDLSIVYRKEDINPHIQQWVFCIEIRAVNNRAESIRQYVLNVSIPKDVVLTSGQTGQF